MDRASINRWDDYTDAMEAMFFFTGTASAPWTIIKSNDKKRARLACMRHFLDSLDYPGKDEDVVGKPDPQLVRRVEHFTGIPDPLIAASPHPETHTDR